MSDIQSMRATLSAATTAEAKLVAAQAIQAFREQPIVPPSRSAQFESYKAAILRGEATPGMLEQIAADERLQDGEDEALLRLAEQHAARRVSAEDAASVAASIRQQLGGQKFAVMTGATNFVSHNDTAYGGLSFKLPSNFAKDGINYVKVLLNESDTYDLTFGKIRGTNYTVLKTVEGVYADNLRETFTDTTGLDVSLGTGGPAPAGGRVTKTEARDAYDALDYLVTSYKQQHDSEFLRADVNERLTPRMDRVRALMARGWPDGATGDPQSLLNHAQDALSRLKRLQDSGLTDDMGRGEAWSYLTNDKGLTGAQADVILATPTSTRMSGTIEQPRYTVAYLNDAASKAPSDVDLFAAAGFRKVDQYTWARTVNVSDTRRMLFNVRASGVPAKYRLTVSVSNPASGVTGAPSREVGVFASQELALQAHEQEIARMSEQQNRDAAIEAARQNQAQLNVRAALIWEGLESAGMKRDEPGRYSMGPVTVFYSAGDIGAQAHLKMEIEAFSKFVVKAPGSPAVDVLDDLASPPQGTVERIMQEVRKHLPAEQPAAIDPQRAADERFLKRIVAGDFSLNDEELFGALEQIGERHASDESMIALFTEAANKVTEAATEAARAAI